jgi:streptomycin 6-kinase
MNTSDKNKLNYYLSTWNLSNPKFLTQTMTSRLYTVTCDSETAILKLLSPAETDEQRGAVALRHFDGHGAVRVLHYDEGAHLLEYAAGEELVTLVERGEDENATRISAQVIKQLHSVPQNQGVVQQSCGRPASGDRVHLCAERRSR